MQNDLKLKTSREFLKNDFPENLLPIKKSSKKYKRLIKEKSPILRKIKKRIKKLDQFLQIKAKENLLKKIYPDLNYDRDLLVTQSESKQSLRNKKICFLFSSDQIKNDLLGKQSQYKRVSDFLLKMKEKKKISFIYGNISRKFLQKAYIQAKKTKGRINENLLIQFESRLDVLLYRICFFKNIASARQSINHNSIRVNGIIVNICSYQIKPGDVISIDRNKTNILANQLIKFLKQNITKRRFRFFISMKHIEKKLKLGLYYKVNQQTDRVFEAKKNRSKKGDYFPTKSLSKHNNSLLQRTVRRSNSRAIMKKKTINKLKRILRNLTKRNNRLKKTKRFSFRECRECILRIHLLSQLPLDKLYSLKVKKLMYKRPSRQALISARRISAMKPLNVEVSYKLLYAIVLFAPQKLVFPATINIDLLSRSLAQN